MKSAKLLLVALLCAAGLGARQSPAPLRFEITPAPGLIHTPLNGRLFVVLGKREEPEPRTTIGNTGLDAAPVFGRDVDGFGARATGVIDASAASFPVDSLSAVHPGDYFVQAVFDSNIDLRSVNAPGNLYSVVEKLHIDPKHGGVVKIQLNRAVPPETLPTEEPYVKWVKIESAVLTQFYGRPIFLRAGVILPKDYDLETTRRYPLRVHIGGYGSRYTTVERMMAPGSEFRRTWLDGATPRMILLHLDGAGPLGDPYQVNSENHGPFGDAVIRELIPYVEKKFRGIGQSYARVLDGGSTGGWVSLALKIFYPDFFNATWSSCPDGVDFRGFQLVNIYEDTNAYVNKHGFERPSERDRNGDVRFTMRHELQMENVLGRGDSWTTSGEQWGAWNAVYGARGADGRPVPLWDPKTGEIHRDAVEHWKRYDLRLVLAENWKTLAPKLNAKLNVWVGDADNYFLNNAVRMLDGFLQSADPPAHARILYGPDQGHCYLGITEKQMMDEMEIAIRNVKP